MNADDEYNAFIKDACGYWKALRDGSSQRANRFERSNKMLVDKWVADGRASEKLSILLQHPLREVKFFAAAGLLQLGPNKEALLLLGEISQEPAGIMPIFAKMILKAKFQQN